MYVAWLISVKTNLSAGPANKQTNTKPNRQTDRQARDRPESEKPQREILITSAMVCDCDCDFDWDWDWNWDWVHSMA